MTKLTSRNTKRILAIAPSSRGFGFAVLEEGKILVDWGVRSIRTDKNRGALKKAEAMIAHYDPAVLVLPNAAAEGSRRSSRIRKLIAEITAVSTRRKMKVDLMSRNQVIAAFFEDGAGTKHTVAQVLARRFPQELSHRLPPKRKPWNSEDYRMGIFDAVALAFANALQN